MSSRLRFLAVWCLLCVLALGADSPKYVFLFIGDGMSLPQRTLAESFLKRTAGEGQQLLINHLPVRASTRTSSANALITDSAASGTAIACGEKTNNGIIGLAPDGKRRLESMAYVAQRAGRKVGIVTSVTINHATPASFYGHRPNRSQYYELGLDLVASNFDYFAGGGCAKNDDRKNPAYKGDIYELARQAGYTVTSTREECARLAPGAGKVFARGASGAQLKAQPATRVMGGSTSVRPRAAVLLAVPLSPRISTPPRVGSIAHSSRARLSCSWPTMALNG